MRYVTPTDHPDNIAVFTAASMAEALLLADEAMRRPKIQGAVWYSQTPPVDWEEERKLTAQYKRVIKKVVEDLSGHIDVVVDSKMLTKNKQTIGFGYSAKPVHNIEIIGSDRCKNLALLTREFERTRLSIRRNAIGSVDPHYDGTNKERVELDPSSLFMGQWTRILHSRTVAGTWVFENSLRDAGSMPPHPKWEVGVGNYLFLVGLEGDQEKALPHSTPYYKRSPDEVPRIVDVYDCRADR